MVALKHILCPVDLSELSIPPLAWAGSIAEWYQSQLTVLHVVPSFEPMEVRPAALFEPVQFVYPMSQEQIEERLRDAMRTAGVTADGARVAAKAGDPSHVIVNDFAVPEFRQYLMRNAREQLEALVAGQPHLERGARMEVAGGRAHRQIARVASDMRADLIVLGAHGRGGPPLAELGSTTEQVSYVRLLAPY